MLQQRETRLTKPSGPALSDAAVDFRQFTFSFFILGAPKKHSGPVRRKRMTGAASLLVEYKRKRSFFCLTLFYTTDVSKRIIKESIYRLVCQCQKAAAATHTTAAGNFCVLFQRRRITFLLVFNESGLFFLLIFKCISQLSTMFIPHPKRRRYGTIG